MRLDRTDVGQLPLATALLSADRTVLARSPEWSGATPGSVVYHAGLSKLMVAPATPTPPGLDALMGRLLGALEAALPALDGESARRVRVLQAGLELISGRPLSEADMGTTSDVLALAESAIRMRAPDLDVEVQREQRPQAVPAPATIALALVQFAVNAKQHEFMDAAQLRPVRSVRLRVGSGPAFYVEWPSEEVAGAQVSTARHQRARLRWGWGYVRLAADALGGVALPPGLTNPGWEGAGFSIGSRLLALPVACFEGGRRVRCTASWEQETGFAHTASQRLVEESLAGAIEAAAAAPGAIVYRDLFCARRSGERTWVALPPETGTNRIKDVLRGLDHERVLWAAPEPHATRVQALSLILARRAGQEWPLFDAASFGQAFSGACQALGLEKPDLRGATLYPDGRVAAFLLAELGGRLRVSQGTLVFDVPPGAVDDPLLGVLEPGGRLTPELDQLFN
ncbi:MAG: hypothetical protein ACR2MZ_13045 [Candidatus Dormibacter sp.]|uniref:hypothetical protein n=1 Tax=Candidatus Dormibacter sp. TaxID=2973982 RepID=UPI000DB14B08|nr:MAG: hypothetical protein DLM66_14440 [Candidatus Dormibacteraeota bacterium]